jgi:hypothetical protein
LPPRQLSVPPVGKHIRVLYCNLTQLCSARIRSERTEAGRAHATGGMSEDHRHPDAVSQAALPSSVR